MNYKHLLVLLTIFLSGFTAQSEIVDLQNAKLVAKNAFYERSYSINPLTYDEISIATTWIEKQDNEAVFYIFNFENGGFVIVAADDILPPVLGYSLTNTCSNIGIDANFDSYMAGFAEQVSLARENNLTAGQEIIDKWNYYTSTDISQFNNINDEIIVPELLTCLWNQDNPYNMLSPEDPMGPGGHALAGCVATAMSMVMYYWRYPLQGEGSHGYSWSPYGYIFADFGATQYNWEQMMDEMDPAYSDIALIQFHCGVAVEMMYSPSGSGAYSQDVPPAIENHFGYSQSSQFKSKEDYSQVDWTNLLKSQIDEKQPMYYSGFSGGGGHAFVCDGYDDSDYFHFNFGWSGSSNGYYTLYEVGGFNSGQGAVINFIPGNNYPYFYTGQQVLNAKSGSFEDGSGPKEDYLADSDINWLIDPQQAGDSISSITLEFSRFELAESDEITVYDGETTTASVLAVFAGTEIPQAVTSTGNCMLVVFKSNSAETANGFLASYTTERPVWCSGLTQMNGLEGDLSDGSLEFDYYNNTICMWRIEPENVDATTIYFTAFDTEAGNDVVKVFDLGTQELIAEYSGNYNGGLPEPVTSPSGQMFVTFSTNKSDVHSGWEAYYTTSIVGVNDLSERTGELIIFPNPATNQVNINLSAFEEEGLQIEIFGMDGKVYFNEGLNIETNSHFHSLNIGNLPTGVYMMRFVQRKKTFTKKLTIQ
jgi:hypothetical protein